MIAAGLINAKLFPFFYFPILLIIKRFHNELSSNKYAINLADIGVVLISMYETISVFLPGHLGVSHQIESIQRILFVSILWFFFRLIIANKEQIKQIVYALSIATGVLSVLTIFYYVKHKQFVMDLGLDDMISFRSFYHPLGFISNDWVALLLCLMPMPVVSIINSDSFIKIAIHSLSYYLVVVSILISFSRGAYLSLLIFLVMVIVLSNAFRYNYRKEVNIVTVTVLIMTCITIYPDRNNVISTCEMSKTTVQRQSIQGRISKWDESLFLFKQSPVFGVGTGNYSVAYDFYAKEKRSTVTRRSTNSYLQMLVEKGIVGSFVMVIALLFIMVESVKSVISDKRKIPLLLAVLSISFRELFFSTFFEENRMQLLCAILLLLIIHTPSNYE